MISFVIVFPHNTQKEVSLFGRGLIGAGEKQGCCSYCLYSSVLLNVLHQVFNVYFKKKHHIILDMEGTFQGHFMLILYPVLHW